MPPPRLLLFLIVVLALLAAACTTDPTTDTASGADDPAEDDTGAEGTAPEDTDNTTAVTTTTFPPAPSAPGGPVDDTTQDALDTIIDTVGAVDSTAVATLGSSGDPRVLWVLSDLIRFSFEENDYRAATDAASELSGLDLDGLADFSWGPLTDTLIAWDLPPFAGYTQVKEAIFTNFEPGWRPFFEDAESQIDWRVTSWGGVRIDDRPLGDPGGCPAGCIPALDDPPLTPADEGDWYPDDAIIFGVQIGEDTVAFPKNIMEVHEMVNATIGGRRVAMPYCTLCGAAQVFFTDTPTESPAIDETDGGIVMRTSGLLRRSNKVMFDLTTLSVFDTFTGAAISGPLLDAGVVLDQAAVVTSTWAAWREAHPDTTILAQDGGIGRDYPLDPLRGRDDDGPIFPIGNRDDRLGVQAPILGVILPDGTPVAFDVEQARATLSAGDDVVAQDVTVQTDADGLVATFDGEPIPSHQAFWFAWSQFHPDTVLWEP